MKVLSVLTPQAFHFIFKNVIVSYEEPTKSQKSLISVSCSTVLKILKCKPCKYKLQVN